MNTNKDLAIQEIYNDFEDFSNLILVQLDMLDKLFEDNSTEVSKETVKVFSKNEKKSDRFEVNISEKIINAIVLHHPVASDLRGLMACYRMSLNLERIGDLILNIVLFISGIKDPSVFKTMSEELRETLSTTRQMVTRSLLSFINKDIESARWAIKKEKNVDDSNQHIVKRSIKEEEFPVELRRILQSYMDMKSVVSNIERIAAHASNIAEASIYAIDGKDVRHQKDKGKNS